ncbi:hypothetical protein Ciccas_005563 [Cichlidogyrus casuarinus]|uniref:Uncharacterized protein n=1 Tax=Cichlidogyrus casuarinus TaxID=1844966 RepID=A0ABD2Q8C3_9PLAT
MTQGTGDLLTSLCSEAWDGRDVVPLRDEDRSAILDFYNRNVYSAYCTGFAYAPVLDQTNLFTPPEPDSDKFHLHDEDGNMIILELPELFNRDVPVRPKYPNRSSWDMRQGI